MHDHRGAGEGAAGMGRGEVSVDPVGVLVETDRESDLSDFRDAEFAAAQGRLLRVTPGIRLRAGELTDRTDMPGIFRRRTRADWSLLSALFELGITQEDRETFAAFFPDAHGLYVQRHSQLLNRMPIAVNQAWIKSQLDVHGYLKQIISSALQPKAARVAEIKRTHSPAYAYGEYVARAEAIITEAQAGLTQPWDTLLATLSARTGISQSALRDLSDLPEHAVHAEVGLKLAEALDIDAASPGYEAIINHLKEMTGKSRGAAPHGVDSALSTLLQQVSAGLKLLWMLRSEGPEEHYAGRPDAVPTAVEVEEGREDRVRSRMESQYRHLSAEAQQALESSIVPQAASLSRMGFAHVCHHRHFSEAGAIDSPAKTRVLIESLQALNGNVAAADELTKGMLSALHAECIERAEAHALSILGQRLGDLLKEAHHALSLDEIAPAEEVDEAEVGMGAAEEKEAEVEIEVAAPNPIAPQCFKLAESIESRDTAFITAGEFRHRLSALKSGVKDYVRHIFLERFALNEGRDTQYLDASGIITSLSPEQQSAMIEEYAQRLYEQVTEQLTQLTRTDLSERGLTHMFTRSRLSSMARQLEQRCEALATQERAINTEQVDREIAAGAAEATHADGMHIRLNMLIQRLPIADKVAYETALFRHIPAEQREARPSAIEDPESYKEWLRQVEESIDITTKISALSHTEMYHIHSESALHDFVYYGFSPEAANESGCVAQLIIERQAPQAALTNSFHLARAGVTTTTGDRKVFPAALAYSRAIPMPAGEDKVTVVALYALLQDVRYMFTTRAGGRLLKDYKLNLASQVALAGLHGRDDVLVNCLSQRTILERVCPPAALFAARGFDSAGYMLRHAWDYVGVEAESLPLLPEAAARGPRALQSFQARLDQQIESLFMPSVPTVLAPRTLTYFEQRPGAQTDYSAEHAMFEPDAALRELSYHGVAPHGEGGIAHDIRWQDKRTLREILVVADQCDRFAEGERPSPQVAEEILRRTVPVLDEDNQALVRRLLNGPSEGETWRKVARLLRSLVAHIERAIDGMGLSDGSYASVRVVHSEMRRGIEATMRTTFTVEA